MGRGQELYKRAKELIPGGTQLLSKRPEMFLPGQWPAYYRDAQGCEVEDLDGRTYLDFSLMGVGACILGYSDADVNKAVIDAVRHGNMSTLNAPEEVELAEMLIEMHPWAQMVRYTRTGGESMAVAIRLARAATGKDVVLFCGYHGWSDWYLAANLTEDDALEGHLLPGLAASGVPKTLADTAIPFRFNDTGGLIDTTKRYKDRVAAIVMEPLRSQEPSPDFIDAVHQARDRLGVPLVMDEITAGFRLNLGGAHLSRGWKPDVAVFGKAISNGHPMGAVIGTRAVMEAAQSSFISSTYWTDRTGPAASLATIRKMQRVDAPAKLHTVGVAVRTGWANAATACGLSIEVDGMIPLSSIRFPGTDPVAAKTYFNQEMLKRGFLTTGAVYASVAHTPECVERYIDACADVFRSLKAHLDADDVQAHLEGPKAHTGFARLN